MMLSKKDFKIVLFCIGLVCIGFIYDNACDYIMSVMDNRTEKIKEETEYKRMVMETIEKDIYNACGLDPYCRDAFIDC